MNLPIYLDNHATTPLDPRVLEAMMPYLTEDFGNAASVDHRHGNVAHRAVEEARESIAKAIGARDSEEIVFTSGATEADNIALIGLAEAQANKGNHIIVSAIEHKAILDSAEYLASKGAQITVLPVDEFGMVDPDDVARAITDQTILVSIMFANNEVGTIEPIEAIGRVTREKGVFFHTDAAQAVGHLDVDVESMNIDLMSISAHKMYGPKGIGALYVRRRHPRVKVNPIIHGGGHERGMRSGTLNVPGIVGFGKAMQLACAEMVQDSKDQMDWTTEMFESISATIEGAERNGHPSIRLPGNLNVYLPSVENRALILELSEALSFSTGSACTTAEIEPSHVLLSMGKSEQRCHESVRFGFGRFNDDREIQQVSELVTATAQRIQNLSGIDTTTAA